MRDEKLIQASSAIRKKYQDAYRATFKEKFRELVTNLSRVNTTPQKDDTDFIKNMKTFLENFIEIGKKIITSNLLTLTLNARALNKLLSGYLKNFSTTTSKNDEELAYLKNVFPAIEKMNTFFQSLIEKSPDDPNIVNLAILTDDNTVQEALIKRIKNIADYHLILKAIIETYTEKLDDKTDRHVTEATSPVLDVAPPEHAISIELATTSCDTTILRKERIDEIIAEEMKLAYASAPSHTMEETEDFLEDPGAQSFFSEDTSSEDTKIFASADQKATENAKIRIQKEANDLYHDLTEKMKLAENAAKNGTPGDARKAWREFNQKLKEISPNFSEYQKFKESAEAIRLMIIEKQVPVKNIPPPKPALDATTKEMTLSFTDKLTKKRDYENIKIFFNLQDNKFCIESKFILSRPPFIGGILYKFPDGYEKKVSIDALKYLLVKQLIDSVNALIEEISSNPKSSHISEMLKNIASLNKESQLVAKHHFNRSQSFTGFFEDLTQDIEGIISKVQQKFPEVSPPAETRSEYRP